MKIADLKVGQKADLEEAKVIDVEEARTFVRFGRPIRVATATIEDDTGKVKLSLWNEQVDQISVGDKIKLTDGFCKDFQGEKQVTTGRQGKIEVIGAGEAPKEAETAEEKTEEKVE